MVSLSQHAVTRAIVVFFWQGLSLEELVERVVTLGAPGVTQTPAPWSGSALSGGNAS
jgi:hypothetical protein